MSLKGKVHELEGKVHDAKSQHGAAKSQIDTIKLPDQEVFRQLGTHFQHWGSQQQDHVQQLESGHAALKASWQGNGADTYSQMHTQMKAVSDKHLEHHQQASNQFNHAADETESVGKLLKNLAKEDAKVAGLSTAAIASVSLAAATFWVPIEGEAAIAAAGLLVVAFALAAAALVSLIAALITSMKALASLVKGMFSILHGLLPGRSGTPNPAPAPPSDDGGKGGDGGHRGRLGPNDQIIKPASGGGDGKQPGGGGKQPGSGGSGGGGGKQPGGGGGKQLPPDKNENPLNEQDIIQQLQSSFMGQQALGIIQRYHTTIRFGRAGGGTYYIPSTNTIYVDPTSPQQDVLIVHEATHVASNFNNVLPDIMTASRDDYINSRVNDEVNAATNQIVYNLEMTRSDSGRPPTTGENVFLQAAQNDPAYQPAYQHAYQQAYDQAMQDPSIPSNNRVAAADLAGHIAGVDAGLQAGFGAGRQAIYNVYVNDRVIASNSGITYQDHFGREWDAAHHTAGALAGASDEEEL